MELHFTLTTDEANIIVKALAKLTFEEVHEIITKLQVQAQPQLAASVTKPSVYNGQERQTPEGLES